MSFLFLLFFLFLLIVLQRCLRHSNFVFQLAVCIGKKLEEAKLNKAGTNDSMTTQVLLFYFDFVPYDFSVTFFLPTDTEYLTAGRPSESKGIFCL